MLLYNLNIYKAIKLSVYNFFNEIKSSCCYFENKSIVKEKLD